LYTVFFAFESSTTKLHRLDENIGAASVELTAEELRQIEEALAHLKVQGDRYPAHLAARAGKLIIAMKGQDVVYAVRRETAKSARADVNSGLSPGRSGSATPRYRGQHRCGAIHICCVSEYGTTLALLAALMNMSLAPHSRSAFCLSRYKQPELKRSVPVQVQVPLMQSMRLLFQALVPRSKILNQPLSSQTEVGMPFGLAF
jgi:hypothetical protein